MSAVIKADQLAATVNKYLSEYGDKVTDIMDEVIKEVTKEAKNEIKRTGGHGDVRGIYRKSWKTKFEKGRLKITGIVYNSKPRPLEFGHIDSSTGRRVGTRVHVAPVNESAQTAVIQKLEGKLRG